jgi:hypothetical protein
MFFFFFFFFSFFPPSYLSGGTQVPSTLATPATPVFVPADAPSDSEHLFSPGGASALAPKARLDLLHALEVWAVDHGALLRTDVVRVGFARASGFGWFARRAVPPAADPARITRGEVLVSVPRRLAITLDTLRGTHLEPLLEVPFEQVLMPYRDRLVLAAFLVNCVFQVNCPWRPFVDTLPGSNEHPLALLRA